MTTFYCTPFIIHFFTKKFMGRKTNSVSLRLKKTNRDYNNCWYSDRFYAESFSKSLKIENYLSQTLKTLNMPCPRTSVIGVFKKAGLLVCYLDPKKRKRLLEKCSKGFQSKRTLQASNDQSGKKGFLFLGKVKQDSKALLKPLDALLQTNLGPQEYPRVSPSCSKEHDPATTGQIVTPKNHGWQPSEYSGQWTLLRADHSSLDSASSGFKTDYALQKASPDFVTQQAEKQTLGSISLGRNQVEIEQKNFHVKKKEEKADSFSKKVKINKKTNQLNYFYRGPISLDLVLNKELAIRGLSFKYSIQAKPLLSFYNICNFLCLERGTEKKKQTLCKNKASKTNATRISLFESLCLKKNHPLNNKNTSFEPFVFSSMAYLKTRNCFSLKDNFFVKKKENSLSGNCNLLDFTTLGSIKKKNYQGKFFNLYEKDVFIKESIKANELIFLKGNKVNQASKESALKKKTKESFFTGLNFFPFFFEKKKSTQKAWFRFQSFSDFFHNEISNLYLISAFSKNNQIFGKNESYSGLSNTTVYSFSPFSSNFSRKGDQDLVEVVPCMVLRSNHLPFHRQLLDMPRETNCNAIDNSVAWRSMAQRDNQGGITQTRKQKGFFALPKKIENGSLTNLYVFYNGISSLWGNLVSLSFYKSTNEISCALFLAECVAYLLEKKVSFRSLKRQLLLELNQSKYSFSEKKSSVLWASKDDNFTSKSSQGSSQASQGNKEASQGNQATQASQALAFPFLENKRKIRGIRITCSGRVGGRSKKAQRSRKDTFMWGETGLHVFSSKLDFHKTYAETPFGLVGVQVWVCTK